MSWEVSYIYIGVWWVLPLIQARLSWDTFPWKIGHMPGIIPRINCPIYSDIFPNIIFPFPRYSAVTSRILCKNIVGISWDILGSILYIYWNLVRFALDTSKIILGYFPMKNWTYARHNTQDKFPNIFWHISQYNFPLGFMVLLRILFFWECIWLCKLTTCIFI